MNSTDLYPYHVAVSDPIPLGSYVWLKNNRIDCKNVYESLCGDEPLEEQSYQRYLCFSKQEDAMMFALRWT